MLWHLKFWLHSTNTYSPFSNPSPDSALGSSLLLGRSEVPSRLLQPDATATTNAVFYRPVPVPLQPRPPPHAPFLLMLLEHCSFLCCCFWFRFLLYSCSLLCPCPPSPTPSSSPVSSPTTPASSCSLICGCTLRGSAGTACVCDPLSVSRDLCPHYSCNVNDLEYFINPAELSLRVEQQHATAGRTPTGLKAL
ncbi:hypothetical protein E2C01_063617 [Portunus trituberculatus]|uniref:Uncharacterized protein n=1 Tax=Portunus trituberculatus TaxID=210409 RepID=A0A5B7HLD7_PORTR|nr:hypothetical protein [Portunus trituberculatus]